MCLVLGGLSCSQPACLPPTQPCAVSQLLGKGGLGAWRGWEETPAPREGLPGNTHNIMLKPEFQHRPRFQKLTQLTLCPSVNLFPEKQPGTISQPPSFSVQALTTWEASKGAACPEWSLLCFTSALKEKLLSCSLRAGKCQGELGRAGL